VPSASPCSARARARAAGLHHAGLALLEARELPWLSKKATGRCDIRVI
jgi:hypothetical protein